MKTKPCNLFIVLAFFSGVIQAAAQGTAFTYQGRLNNGSNPANGGYDLTFSLFSVASGGSAVTGPLTNSATIVSNGLFLVSLDFGGVFTGTNYWLEIGVRTNGNGAFTTLAPRQPVTPTPYAIFAEGSSNLVGVVPNGGLGGTYGSAVTMNNLANQFNGSFTGNGGGLTNLNVGTLGGLTTSNFWQLGGNNVNPGDFLGSTNNQPVEIRVNNSRALRLELNTDSPNVIGGASVNAVGPGVQGATIAGGGSVAFYGGPYPNRVDDFHGTIGGGLGNWIQISAIESTIAGGNQNQIQNGAYRSAIGGGFDNMVGTNASSSTIGGGSGNSIRTNAYESTIAGGIQNVIQDDAFISTIGGGAINSIQTDAYESVIGGGKGNTISTNASHSTISGGYFNNASESFSTVGGGLFNTANGGQDTTVGGGEGNVSSGFAATIAGGWHNTAGGIFSFAAGQQANALYTGDFVWADSQNTNFSSTASDQFCIRAKGGVVLDNSTPAINFGNQTRQMLNLWNANYGIGVQDNTEYFRSGGDFAWFRGGIHSNAHADAGGGVVNMFLDSNGNLGIAGAFYPSSDRNLKAGFEPVDQKTILEKVTALPISRWHFTNEVAMAHIGPMAQDFRAAFGLGMDDKHIATVDESGVALAAIQGLNEKLEGRSQRAEEGIRKLEAANGELKKQNDLLAARLNELEAAVKQLASQK
jgi:hypothetical protein